MFARSEGKLLSLYADFQLLENARILSEVLRQATMDKGVRMFRSISDRAVCRESLTQRLTRRYLCVLNSDLGLIEPGYLAQIIKIRVKIR